MRRTKRTAVRRKKAPVRKALPSFRVFAGQCLGYTVYRGYGLLRDLAEISKPDIFDQQKNPTGTQRNLSRQHARKAYQYVTEVAQAFYPEIILNIRDISYVNIELGDVEAEVSEGTLRFAKDPTKTPNIIVLRLDGNHRLWFADGHESSMEAVQKLPDTDVFSAKGGIPFAGRAGGRKIAADLVADLEEEGEISVSKLQKLILGQTK